MTLDMMFANLKADDKQDLDSKAGDSKKQDFANKAGDSKKQDFADKMQAIQESTVNAAWKSFKETLEGLKDDTPAEEVEKAFKKCCDSAIAATLLAAAIMC